MRKKLYPALALLPLIVAASCSKDSSNNPTPASISTSAKFSTTFPAAFQMDSIVYSYHDANNAEVNGRITGASTWESPAITYTTGKTAYALVNAYGKVTGASVGNTATLYLIKAADNTVITAQGTNSTSGTSYRFTGSINYTF